MAETEEEVPSPGRSGGTLAWVILAAPLLYILSIGPALMFLGTWWSLDVFEVIYAPVIWLHDHTPLEKPLEWYLQLWGVK